MATFIDLDTFKDATIAAPEWADEVHARYPTFFAKQFALVSAYMEGRLRKRYPNAFVEPYPLQLVDWAAHILTYRMMNRRGIDATDEQAEDYRNNHDRAVKEVDEASDSENGRWDIPLRADTTATGITQPEPLGYSETSPYVWMDVQAETGIQEDASGGGTS